MTTREQVYTEARTWVGTEYHHQARRKGVGVDCLGLEICVCWELGLKPRSFDVRAYPRQADGVTLLRLAREHMIETTRDLMGFGDVIVTESEGVAHHLGILAPYRHSGFSIIHALPEHGVVETRLMFTNLMRFSAAFRLPGVQ